ncbi:hypothetical protein SCLCIDRAFT_1220342 [Scleroderma citrinum Foug A]|uniref:Uncharacterized protein n=1 Tax=Scleroderma citrinum Foug A TaxID=1036808 RepID=A0A0C2ZVM0_9AGAM|nr:hypothetical protein SCLCIDRAFT_1220342 [Scleroderma citrinum Foug A]
MWAFCSGVELGSDLSENFLCQLPLDHALFGVVCMIRVDALVVRTKSEVFHPLYLVKRGARGKEWETSKRYV